MLTSWGDNKELSHGNSCVNQFVTNQVLLLVSIYGWVPASCISAAVPYPGY